MAKKQRLSMRELELARQTLIESWGVTSSAFQMLPASDRQAMPRWARQFFKAANRSRAAAQLRRLNGRDIKFLCRLSRKLEKLVA